MALHTSSVHFEGSHSASMTALLEQLNYRLVNPPAMLHTAEAAVELLDKDTGNRNVVRKAVYESGGWTYLHDPEMVVMTEDGVLSDYASKNRVRIFSWICEGVSRSYGFKMFAPGVVRDVLAVGGKVVTNGGARVAEEGALNWAACSERDVMQIAERLGAPFDGFSNDRAYEIYTLDESHMPVPDLSGMPTAMPFRAEDLVVRVAKRPWWKLW
jgi:hypothetical protein